MKFRYFSAVPFLSFLAASCAPQSGEGDYDVANPYAAPDYVEDSGTPYDPGNLNPTYDVPAVYEDTAAPAVPSSPVAAAPRVHTVVRGDSLWAISKQYGVSIDAIKSANALTRDTAVLGARLQIPAQ